MIKIALLFPGQGSQFVGMGKELYEGYPEARKVFEDADRLLGMKLSEVCFSGPEATLRETAWCQPAIYVHSLATLAVLLSKHPDFHFQATAGLSLGEFTALTAAGWISFDDGLRTVQRRGAWMQEACESTHGTMAAMLGMELQPLKALCKEVDIDLANLNCPGQYVISGENSKVDRALELAKERGGRKSKKLTVAGAYHSRLMKSASEKLREGLVPLRITSSTIQVVSNVTGRPHTVSESKDLLVQQVTSAVLWEDSIRFLIGQGFQHFLEVGPGTVLSGFMKRIDPTVKIISIGKPEDFGKLENSEWSLKNPLNLCCV